MAEVTRFSFDKDLIAQEQITEESKSEVFYLGFNVNKNFKTKKLSSY